MGGLESCLFLCKRWVLPGCPVLQAPGAKRALMSGLVNKLQLGRKKSDVQTNCSCAHLSLENRLLMGIKQTPKRK